MSETSKIEKADPPRMRITTVTLAAPNPRELAAFYEKLLGWQAAKKEGPRPGYPPEDGWAIVRPPSGQSGPSLAFEYEQDYVPPVWPSKPGEQQLMEHLDIEVQHLASAVAFAIEAGAKLAEYQPQKDVRVMLDPAGHPFCLFLGSG